MWTQCMLIVVVENQSLYLMHTKGGGGGTSVKFFQTVTQITSMGSLSDKFSLLVAVWTKPFPGVIDLWDDVEHLKYIVW